LFVNLSAFVWSHLLVSASRQRLSQLGRVRSASAHKGELIMEEAMQCIKAFSFDEDKSNLIIRSVGGIIQ
jgi:hypothetical protein